MKGLGVGRPVTAVDPESGSSNEIGRDPGYYCT